jgi:hypothetical protein
VRAPIAAADKEPFLRVAGTEHGSDVVSESSPCGSQRTKDFVNNQSLPDARTRCSGHATAYARWPRTGAWRGRSWASAGYSHLCAGRAWWRHSIRPSETQSASNSAHHDFCPRYAHRTSIFSQPEEIGRTRRSACKYACSNDGPFGGVPRGFVIVLVGYGRGGATTSFSRLGAANWCVTAGWG